MINYFNLSFNKNNFNLGDLIVCKNNYIVVHSEHLVDSQGSYILRKPGVYKIDSLEFHEFNEKNRYQDENAYFVLFEKKTPRLLLKNRRIIRNYEKEKNVYFLGIYSFFHPQGIEIPISSDIESELLIFPPKIGNKEKKFIMETGTSCWYLYKESERYWIGKYLPVISFNDTFRVRFGIYFEKYAEYIEIVQNYLENYLIVSGKEEDDFSVYKIKEISLTSYDFYGFTYKYVEEKLVVSGTWDITCEGGKKYFVKATLLFIEDSEDSGDYIVLKFGEIKIRCPIKQVIYDYDHDNRSVIKIIKYLFFDKEIEKITHTTTFYDYD
jgi:hypothetical protein